MPGANAGNFGAGGDNRPRLFAALDGMNSYIGPGGLWSNFLDRARSEVAHADPTKDKNKTEKEEEKKKEEDKKKEEEEKKEKDKKKEEEKKKAIEKELGEVREQGKVRLNTTGKPTGLDGKEQKPESTDKEKSDQDKPQDKSKPQNEPDKQPPPEIKVITVRQEVPISNLPVREITAKTIEVTPVSQPTTTTGAVAPQPVIALEKAIAIQPVFTIETIIAPQASTKEGIPNSFTPAPITLETRTVQQQTITIETPIQPTVVLAPPPAIIPIPANIADTVAVRPTVPAEVAAATQLFNPLAPVNMTEISQTPRQSEISNIQEAIKAAYVELVSSAIPLHSAPDTSAIMQVKTWLTSNANEIATNTPVQQNQIVINHQNLMTFLNNAIVSNEGKVNQQQVAQLIEAFTVVHNLINQNPQPIFVPRAPAPNTDSAMSNNQADIKQLATLSNSVSPIPSIKPIVSFAPNTDQNTTIPITLRSEANSSAIRTAPLNFSIVSTENVTRSPAPVTIYLAPRPDTLQETKPAIRTEAQHLLNNNIVQALTLLNVIQATPFSNWNAVLGDKQGSPASALTAEQPKSKPSLPESVTIRTADPVAAPVKSPVVFSQPERVQPINSVLATPVMHTASNRVSPPVASREIALDQAQRVRSVIETGYLQITSNISSKTPVDTIFAAVVESAEKQLGRPMNIQEIMLAKELVYSDAARQITDIGSATPYSGSLTTTIKSGGVHIGSMNASSSVANTSPTNTYATAAINSAGSKTSGQSGLNVQHSSLSLTNLSQYRQNSLQAKRNQKTPPVFTVSTRTALSAGIAI